jgi:hypothetical protein
MPKHDIFHKAGEPVSNELKELLLRFFDEYAVNKLERFGGRLQISLASPFMSRRNAKRKVVEINIEFVSELRELKDKPEILKEKLADLTIKQLKNLGKLIDLPLRTKSSRQEMIDELIRNIHSEEIWKRISNIQ